MVAASQAFLKRDKTDPVKGCCFGNCHCRCILASKAVGNAAFSEKETDTGLGSLAQMIGRWLCSAAGFGSQVMQAIP